LGDFLDIVLRGLDAKGEMRRLVAAAADVLGFDRADGAFPVAGGEETEKGLAVAVGATHDLLLEFAPVGAFQEVVEDRLGLAAEAPVTRLLSLGGDGAIAESLADNVGDPVLEGVERERVEGRQPAREVAEDLQAILGDVDRQQLALEAVVEVEGEVLAGEGEEEVGRF
jgi:hypothetical protein